MAQRFGGDKAASPAAASCPKRPSGSWWERRRIGWRLRAVSAFRNQAIFSPRARSDHNSKLNKLIAPPRTARLSYAASPKGDDGGQKMHFGRRSMIVNAATAFRRIA
jgi:hypothetical protein